MIDKEKIKRGVTEILEALGCNLDDENFRNTPQRVADMFEEILNGKFEPKEVVRFTTSSDLVLIGNIDFTSMCPHHLLPVLGKAYVAYIPKNKVVGLSKLVRAVYKWTRRLILQEEATTRILEEIKNITLSNDVFVVLKAQHMCMRIRGVRSNSIVTTTAASGVFKDLNKRLEIIKLMENDHGLTLQ